MRTKIKIRVLSDLHMEHHRFTYVPMDEDVVVLPGDIDNGFLGITWALDNIPEQTPVIYVPGNHEYDHAEHRDVEARMREHASGTNVHLLLNDRVVIKNTLFVGGTMWSDLNLFGVGEQWFVEMAVRRGVSDYHIQRIFDSTTGRERLWSTVDSRKEFAEFDRFLQRELKTKRYDAKNEYDARVVVSHFVPHRRSVAQRFKADLITPYFASDMSHIMPYCDLWIHGHTHDSFDYMLGDTRVVCNPRGYPQQPSEFDPFFTVDI